MNSLTTANIVKPQGMFAGQQRVLLVHHAKHGLKEFLSRDTGQAFIYKEFTVSAGQMLLSLRINEGRVHALYGLSGIERIFAGIRQEVIGERTVKVFYGWRSAEDRGKQGKVLIKYILAEKTGGDWRIFLKPESLNKPHPRTQAIKDNSLLAKAMTEGLGRSVLRKYWLISPPHHRAVLRFQDRFLYIHGFPGRRKVFSLIKEESNEIVARFYAKASDAAKGKRELLLKTVVFSERGTDGRWRPLPTPKLVFTAPATSAVQHKFFMAHQLKQFLLDDRAPGAFYDVGTRRVNKDTVIFHFYSESLRLNGLSGHASVTGRIVNQGTKKVIYFWPDEAAKQSGAPPIFPEGQTVAKKTTSGKWEIVWFDLSQGRRQAALGAIKLGNYIFANADDRIHTTPWPVKDYSGSRHGQQGPYALRVIRGKVFTVATAGAGVTSGNVLSQTREFGRRLKLIEFWPNQPAFARHSAPFAASFIAVNTKKHSVRNGSTWRHFWHRFDNSAKTTSALQQLIDSGTITYNILTNILSNSYFIDHPHLAQRAYKLIDALKPRG
jgi:hypothetical protein